MNLDEPLRVISCALSESGLPGVTVKPGRWHVLFGGRPRPLLMPADDYQRQKRWLSYFIGGSLRTWYAMTLLRVNNLLPAIGLLPEFKMPREVGMALRESASQLDGAVAGAPAVIQIGTPGPYQKASALLISRDGAELALAKIALAESADPMVVVESGWLRELEALEKLKDQVPRLLAEGVLANGRRYLVISLAPSTRVTTEFTPAHDGFLARLGRSRMEIMRFATSPCCENLERMIDEISPALAREEVTVLRNALGDCHKRLYDHVGPFVLSQGDFTWWNIRLGAQGIFVFDWEYAQRGANPLTDLFHYHLIQRAAAGRRIGRWFLAAVMRRAQTFARLHYPESRWRVTKISALALAYVLEVLTQYVRAIGGIDRSENVMRGYWSLIERRSAWMAA